MRPDRDSHYAVASVGEPSDRDPPVFVELDALLDAEDHAMSDTRVELGGVLLGGHYQDSEGKPFVLVTDALRARHYESTRGSFKFTHDTWQEITRQRDGYGPDARIVGWYHTHPGWGVFLSGMDLFICEHFFNRPLDLALVIDPCRSERAFFQWSETTPRQVQQSSGYYLIASRFREHELDAYARLFTGETDMSQDPRTRGLAASPAPSIVINDSSRSWQSIAVLGSLTIQLAVLALLFWRFAAEPSESRDAARQASAAQQALAELTVSRIREHELNAKAEVLDAVVGKTPDGQKGLVSSLLEKSSEAEDLRSNLRGQRALQEEADRRFTAVQADLQKSSKRNEQLAAEVERMQIALAELRTKNSQQEQRIADLQQQSGKATDPSRDGIDAADRPIWESPGVLIGAAVGLLGLITLALVRYRRFPGGSHQSPDIHDRAGE